MAQNAAAVHMVLFRYLLPSFSLNTAEGRRRANPTASISISGRLVVKTLGVHVKAMQLSVNDIIGETFRFEARYDR